MKVIFIILSTVLLYLLMSRVYARFSNPFLSPLLTTTLIIIVVLVMTRSSYQDYMLGGQWINRMLGPAIVSLAYPLYSQKKLIRKNIVPIASSIFVAMISGLVSVCSLAFLLRFDEQHIRSLLPKSITTPVAMQISDVIGGIPPLTAVFVIIAGFTGAMLGPLIFKWCRIETSVSRGIAMGSASHGFGISKLTEYGEQALSMGSVSMTLSAIVGAFLCPLFAWIVF